MESARTTCAVVGGGPAGLVLGLLLARAGVAVTVLEKHADFLRDFRGDTVHPSTLTALDDLGLFARFDALPHSRVERVALPDGAGGTAVLADFGRLRVAHPYIAMVPQWDLLDLLAGQAAREPGFTLLREHEVTALVRSGGRVHGVEFSGPAGPGRLEADLVVACDGRGSVVRRAAGLRPRTFGVGFDVWWFRVPTGRRAPEALVPRAGRGGALIPIPREGYVQVAYLGPKGTDADLRRRGLEDLRERVAGLLPELAGELGGLRSLDDVKVLDVRLDRLRRWWAPGVLCIGDAAHAMSPVGGVGINLAVQDAIATARLLAAPLREGAFGGAAPSRRPRRLLARVQRRRGFPTVVVQGVQRVLHRRVVAPALAGRAGAVPDGALRLLRRFPALSAVPAAFIGIGPRPERVPAWARVS
ncbi:FAD-dependent oxidoreductase [Kineococcus sp. SYSU DK001]|uniref:FAD-dependent oxidoreductase n=1 Tax=Kineococcus sp. SYSU DK001 TaxID=3383122 RepID=UPI003D7CC615